MNKRLEVEWAERQAERTLEFVERLNETAIRIFRQAVKDQMIKGTISDYNLIKRTVYRMYDM